MLVCALAQYYASSPAQFGDYFCTLMDFLMRASDYAGPGKEFVLYCCALVLVEVYFQAAQDKDTVVDQFYSTLAKVYQRNR